MTFVLQTTASDCTFVTLLGARAEMIRKVKATTNMEDAEINARLISYCSDQVGIDLQTRDNFGDNFLFWTAKRGKDLNAFQVRFSIRCIIWWLKLGRLKSAKLKQHNFPVLACEVIFKAYYEILTFTNQSSASNIALLHLLMTPEIGVGEISNSPEFVPFIV